MSLLGRFGRVGRWFDGPALAGTGKGRLGLALFLVSLGAMFLAAMVAFVSIRLEAGNRWPPPGAPQIPRTIWLSTLLVVGTSVVMAAALTAVRRDLGHARLAFRLGMALVLAVAFLGTQTAVWIQLQLAGGGVRSSVYGFTFNVFTALHAVHVLGGIVPLAFVLWRARRGAYDARRHGAVAYTATYWHFLSGVWLLLFALMVLW